MTTTHRSEQYAKYIDVPHSWTPSWPQGRDEDPVTAYEARELYSEGHPWRSGGVGLTGDIGGPFLSRRWTYEDSRTLVDIAVGSTRYRGPIYAYQAGSGKPWNGLIWGSVPQESTSEVNLAGAKAVRLTIPTNPVFSAGQFLGELRQDGVPRIIGSGLLKQRAAHFRTLGDEYLNVEFGWKPFASDLTKFARAVSQSHKILERYRANSGKLIPRRFVFPDESASSSMSRGTMPPAYGGGWPSGAFDWHFPHGELLQTTTTTKRQWFSGAYTYHLPVGDATVQKMARFAAEANKLLGVRITPETLWQLTPWSWAVDWIGNIGDVIHNATAFSQDSLVMHHGYLMTNKVVTVDFTHTGEHLIDGSFVRPWQRWKTEVKQRDKASPYGFGLDLSAFSERQWAILAALGLSRGPHLL